MIAIFRTPKTPWPLWAIATGAYCAGPFLDSAYYQIMAANGAYPSNADSIGIPIAFNFAGSLLLLPVVALILWWVLSRYPGATALWAWHRERPVASVTWTVVWLLTLLGSLRSVRSDCRVGMWFALPFDCISMYFFACCRAILVVRPPAKIPPRLSDNREVSMVRPAESSVCAGLLPCAPARPTMKDACAITGGAIAFTALVLALRLIPPAPIKPDDSRVPAFLRQLALYSLEYARQHDDHYPPRIEDALAYLGNDDARLSRFVRNNSIIYTPPTTKEDDTPTNHVLFRYEGQNCILECPTKGDVRTILK